MPSSGHSRQPHRVPGSQLVPEISRAKPTQWACWGDSGGLSAMGVESWQGGPAALKGDVADESHTSPGGAQKDQDPDSSSKELTGLCPGPGLGPQTGWLHQELQEGSGQTLPGLQRGRRGWGRHFIRTHPHCAAVHRVAKNKTAEQRNSNPPAPTRPPGTPLRGCRRENSSVHNFIRRVGRWLRKRHRAVGVVLLRGLLTAQSGWE